MSGPKITAYLDCGRFSATLEEHVPSCSDRALVSPFSYFALVHLEKNKALLESHHVEIEYAHQSVSIGLQTHLYLQTRGSTSPL